MFETTSQIRENHVNKEHVFWSMYGNMFFTMNLYCQVTEHSTMTFKKNNVVLWVLHIWIQLCRTCHNTISFNQKLIVV